ncbi:hypothetical protein SUDANB19_01141 [Streptomyces sp. enrichment culture]
MACAGMSGALVKVRSASTVMGEAAFEAESRTVE